MNSSHAPRLRILFVSPATPFSPRSGAEQRSALMYEALRALGDVDILILGEGKPTTPRTTLLPAGEVVIETQKKGGWGLKRFHPDAGFTQTISALLPHRLMDYKLIIGRYLWPVSQLLIPTHVPVIVDLDDFKYRYSPEAGFSIGLLAERIKKRFAHALARRELQKFAGAFLVNAQDRSEVTQLPTCALPNIAYSALPATPATPLPQHNHLLFVGSLWYRPNADGVDWFLAKVWPGIKRVIPDAQLTLVGAASPLSRARWEKHAGVTAPGFVDDLAAAYADATLVIVPIHVGGGSNIKVLEALGHARPCVVTRLTAAAFSDQLHHGQHFFVADNAHQFAECVLQVLQQPQAYRAMAVTGYETVRAKFSAESFKAQVASFAREVLA